MRSTSVTDRLWLAVVLTVATLTVSACSTSGAMPEGSPPNGALPHVPPQPPPVTWAEDAEHLVVVTYGSSSCPAGPTDLAVVGDQEIRLEIGPLFPDRDPCTADMAARTTEVELPDGSSVDERLTVLPQYEGEPEQVVRLPPRS
jgi:hypothetical protein